MKKVCMLCILLVLTIICIPGSSLAYSVEVDWQMSLQGGVSYCFNEYLGVKGGLGISLMGLLAAESYLVVDPHLVPKPWRATLLVGIPNFLVPSSFNAAMLSLGGALEVERDISPSLTIALRVGAGFPLFFEEGKALVRDVRFPFGLWPEVVLSLGFH